RRWGGGLGSRPRSFLSLWWGRRGRRRSCRRNGVALIVRFLARSRRSRFRRSLVARARLGIPTVRLRFQRKLHVAFRVLIYGTLHVELVHLHRVLAAVVHVIVQLAVRYPIVARRERRAVLEINKNRWSRKRDVAGRRIRVSVVGIT